MKPFVFVASYSGSKPWVVDCLDEWTKDNCPEVYEERLSIAEKRTDELHVEVIEVPDDFLDKVANPPMYEAEGKAVED